jgi:hypothetical protein
LTLRSLFRRADDQIKIQSNNLHLISEISGEGRHGAAFLLPMHFKDHIIVDGDALVDLLAAVEAAVSDRSRLEAADMRGSERLLSTESSAA